MLRKDVDTGRTDVGGGLSSQRVVTPQNLVGQQRINDTAADNVRDGREAVRAALAGDDDRLLVVAGPCSIHDVDAGLEYAKSLRVLADELADDVVVAMRMYFEKPRTTVGWPGLLTDPEVDGSRNLEDGLRSARRLALEVAELGLPIGTEWLSSAAPAYLADLVSWGAIGARTVESQVHRQLASSLPMPVGMKNNPAGSVSAAVNAVRSAAEPHTFLGAGVDGQLAVQRSSGNPDCHVVLRGAEDGPNFGTETVRGAADQLADAGLGTGLVVDASHGNSGKDHERQATVARELAAQIASGNDEIRGVMLESFLVAGKQNYPHDGQVFGQSITDACMGWDTTVEALHRLAEAARHRRSSPATPPGTFDPWTGAK